MSETGYHSQNIAILSGFHYPVFAGICLLDSDGSIDCCSRRITQLRAHAENGTGEVLNFFAVQKGIDVAGIFIATCAGILAVGAVVEGSDYNCLG